MSSWLGVASAEHVARGVGLGIAQIGHGKRAGLARLRDGDTLVYYSPVTRLADSERLQVLTAFGQVAGEEIWQADEGDFHPYRRRVTYHEVQPVALSVVRDQLDLTSGPSWGYQLRRGLVQLTEHDAQLLGSAMIRP